ncbi:MAG: hypothetical protein ACREA9_06595 [Pyrinomonadaceae bacterium]
MSRVRGMKKSTLVAVLLLPLMPGLLWQGSSCRSANSNVSNNRAGNYNVNANASMNINTNSNAGQTAADMKGVWGGLHINIEVADSGATIEYVCAHGTITEKIVPDREGRFVVKGRHIKERPGPIREGDDTEGQPATYTGSIDGQTMTLTVKLSGTDEEIGSFTLTHGKTGRNRKCM